MGQIHYDRAGTPYLVEFDFLTMVNKVDPARLNLERGECPAIINMLTTRTGNAFTRDGFTQVISGEVWGGWSNGTVAYYMRGSYLCSFDGTTETILTMITPTTDYDFCEVNDVVVFSNGIDILFLEGDSVSYPDMPVENFEVATVPGVSLEFYNGRLYIANGNCIYCTKSFNLSVMDERMCVIATYDCPVTMIRRVDDGMYVSTEREVFFLQGDDPFGEGGFKQEILASTGCIKGTAIKTNGDAFPAADIQGSVVVFATPKGIFVGGNGGSYKNLSFDKISYGYGERGAAAYYEKNGEHYYLVSMPQDYSEDNKYVIPTFEVDQQEV